MPHRLAMSAVAAVALCGLAATRAAELSAECKPVFAAVEKSLQIDHTTVSTRGADTLHGVTVGGAMWLQVGGGSWRKSSMTVQDNLAQSRENLKNAKEYTCKSAPDSVVDGIPVTNWATRTVNDDTTIETRIAIAKGSGLVVSVENRRSGEGSTSNVVSKYGYGNVKAPI